MQSSSGSRYVRLSGARKLAEKEQIDIRLYSVIYQAIEELKSAMEGMLSPEIKEEIIATVEVLETFKISKVGTIAGCIVRDGKITRTAKIRVIREGIVIYTGVLGSLKRFKDDVKEVTKGIPMWSEYRELQRHPGRRHDRRIPGSGSEKNTLNISDERQTISILLAALYFVNH